MYTTRLINSGECMTLSIEQARQIIEEFRQKELALGIVTPQQLEGHLNHINGAAYIARAIAQAITSKLPEINSDEVYVSTLLHDIGRLEEPRVNRFHGIIGYEKLKERDENAARTALIHMFPLGKLPPFELCSDLFLGEQGQQDYDFVANYLKKTPLTEGDLLIQLADCLANKDGFVTLDQRFTEYQERHHIILPKELRIPRYQLKNRFDQILGHSVYDLFPKTENISTLTLYERKFYEKKYL